MFSRPPVSFKNSIEKMEYKEEQFKLTGFEVIYFPLKDTPSGGGSFKWISSTTSDGRTFLEKVFVQDKPTATRCDVVWNGDSKKKKRSLFLREIEAKNVPLKEVPKKHYLLPQWALDEYTQSRKFSNNRGFHLMDKMGWVPNTPLGIRGEGIIDPIMQTQKDRVQGDYAGIGYEEEIFDLTPENEFIEIICIGDHYGVALWGNEKVFVPKGAIKHLINILRFQINLVGICVMADIVMEEGKRYKWRVTKIREVVDIVF
jgi:hypothetical protein